MKINGEPTSSSSIGRSLSRHKAKHPEEQGGGGEAPGGAPDANGQQMMVAKNPDGSFHTSTPQGEHMDHPTIEHATQHMHKHFGHKSEKKEPHEQEQAPMPEAGGGLDSMGVAG
jgi:hypothetical protein